MLQLDVPAVFLSWSQSKGFILGSMICRPREILKVVGVDFYHKQAIKLEVQVS